MGILSKQHSDVKLEVADLFLQEISDLNLDDREKLKLIQILDQDIDSNSELIKHLLNVDNLQEIFQTFINESEDFLQDEAMRDDT